MDQSSIKFESFQRRQFHSRRLLTLKVGKRGELRAVSQEGKRGKSLQPSTVEDTKGMISPWSPRLPSNRNRMVLVRHQELFCHAWAIPHPPAGGIFLNNTIYPGRPVSMSFCEPNGCNYFLQNVDIPTPVKSNDCSTIYSIVYHPKEVSSWLPHGLTFLPLSSDIWLQIK